MQIIYSDNTLNVKNTKLNLNTIYKNYNEISSNDLSLGAFIRDYINNSESKKYEKDNMLILETKTDNNYFAYKKLYINKENCNPVKIEIEDITHKLIIYILYNEIEINNLQKEEILAFNLEMRKQDI